MPSPRNRRTKEETRGGRLGSGEPTALAGLRPEPPEGVSAIRQPSTGAEELAQAAAAALRPELFEPFIRKVADAIYERLLDGVQDYLISNVEFNIGSRIEAAEREARTLRAEGRRYYQALVSIGALNIQSHFVTDSVMRQHETRCLSAHDVGKIVEAALHPAREAAAPAISGES